MMIKTLMKFSTLLVVLVLFGIGCGLGGNSGPVQVVTPEPDGSESSMSEEMSHPQDEGLVLTNVLDGTPLTLDAYAGKVLLINFWATWCPPCRHEIPDLIRLQSDYGSQGLQIIGISIEPGNETGVADFVRENGINYPVAITTDEAEAMFGSPRAVPTTYIVNREGAVVETIVGGRSYSAFASAITPHL